ncbi:MAG TPA: hypothetical protein DDX72_10465 [Ruminococcaceae bacterium]|nr:hypothetical protein [Oscillospiraceae bacterium]
MKSPQGQKHETAGIRTPAYKTALRKQRKCMYAFRIFELAPSKNPRQFCFSKLHAPTSSDRRLKL